MKRFSLITASLLPLALAAGILCSCHKPAVTTSSSATTATSQTTATVTSVSESTTSLTETTPAVPSDSETSFEGSIIATATDTFVEDRHLAMGKFNYVLKNKEWKFDGEMNYHKYKDGTVVYYDKESKSWFVMDNKGQGWYYDPDIKDFVRDE